MKPAAGGYLARNARWLAAGATLTFLSSFGQTFFISLFAGEIRGEFGLTHGQWGSIYSAGTVLSAIVMVWSGALTDVFRVRTLGPAVLAGLAFACAMMAWNQTAWMLPAVVFLLRLFGQGMCTHIAMVAMTRWFTATRGRALSIATMGFALGEATLPLIFVTLMGVVDWRLLWLLVAFLALSGIPALMMFLTRERTPQSIAKEQSSTGMDGRHWTRKAALADPLFWLTVPALLGPGAFNTAFFFHQVHFAGLKGWTHFELVAWFPVYTAVSVAAMFLSGWLLDRMGTARLMPYYQLPMVLAFLFLSVSAGVFGIIAGLLFLSLTTGANSTLPSAFLAEFYGTAHIGAIKALAAAIMVLGSAVGPGVTGVLIDLGVGLEQQFLGIAVYFMFASLMMATGIIRARSRLLS